MIDSKTKLPVTVEKAETGFLVRLHDTEQADHLEDRLTEDFDIDPIWPKFEDKVTILYFPETENQNDLQAIVDQIT